MRNMKFLTVAVASVALAGCGANSFGTPNTSMYSVHQPVVERTNFAIDLNSNGDSLSSVDQSRLAEWFDALQLGYGDRVFGRSWTGLCQQGCFKFRIAGCCRSWGADFRCRPGNGRPGRTWYGSRYRHPFKGVGTDLPRFHDRS